MLVLNIILLSGEPIRSESGSEFISLLIRILLFVLFLLVFVFACGLAWRTLPGLKAILPVVEPRIKEPIRVSLANPVEVTTLNFDSPETEGHLRPAGAAEDPLARAIADGRPGSVVKAASEFSQPPIILVRRPDSSRPES